MAVTELELNDKNNPEESGLDLWIGRTATDDQSIEFYIGGIINLQSESLSCTLSKQDALLLAGTLLKALKEY
jgi:CYTH domain-containing protein